MSWLVIIAILILFFVLEFIAAFGFNIKLKMLAKNRYTAAAVLGSISTALFMFMTLSTPLIAADIDGAWFIFAGALTLALGNMLAVIVIGPYERWVAKRTEKGDEE